MLLHRRVLGKRGATRYCMWMLTDGKALFPIFGGPMLSFTQKVHAKNQNNFSRVHKIMLLIKLQKNSIDESEFQSSHETTLKGLQINCRSTHWPKSVNGSSSQRSSVIIFTHTFAQHCPLLFWCLQNYRPFFTS